MRKIIFLSLLMFLFSVSYVFAQEKQYNVDGRFIVVENPASLFVEKDNCMEISEHYIHNFNDDVSSKPEHVAVNELENVIKFGIASNSERYYNQRRFYIRLAKDDYKKTFYNALITMGVKAVVVNDKVMTVEEFYNYLLKF